MAGYLAERYAEIADEGAAGTSPMGTVLRLIADESAAPTVFHCVAGKDRTGVVAALVLALLGVSDETIAEDYAASQAAEDRYFAWRAANRPDLPPSASAGGNAAPRDAILTFLSGLRSRYGSVIDYVERAGLDRVHRAALRDRLLCPGSPLPATPS
jgi:protein-tyrosine phosphatase